LSAAAPAALNLASIGKAGGAPEAAGLGAPAAAALATRKPSKFALLLQGLLRGRRDGTGAEAGRKAGAPAKARPQAVKPGTAPAAGEVRRSAARTGDVPARGNPAELGGRPLPAGTEAAGKRPVRKASRRDPEKPAEADLPLTGKRPGDAPGAGPLARGDLQTAAKRPGAGAKGRPAGVPRVLVIDLRRPARPAEGAGSGEHRAEAPAKRPAAPEPSARETGLAVKEAGFERQLARAAKEAPVQGEPPLSRAFAERVIPQIVQRTGIILRDGGEGEIRLVLKPEHLGAVRVRLHLGESSLEGRFVVENNIIKELLEANLEHLKSALRQEGFASPNLEVSVGGGRPEGRAPSDGGPAAWPFTATGGEAREFERGAPLAWEAGLGYSTVNIWI
jgi:hypothetical protein